ncbi:MAG: Crp/Fnr family transcriptional regulator [Bosea sp. (in: a-proteobacteria)]|uniref:Crp/Fnr family transcriptional regulator n=1 Tax=Bosea sp. (in: a-proteobacteria) TaxID=1871050 RepID=UPI003F7B44BC
MSIDPDLLRGFPVVSALSAEERRSLADAASLRPLRANEAVFVHGEPATELCLVLSGRIKLSKAGWARDPVILRIAHPGEFLELGRSLRPGGYGATANALCGAELAVWPTQVWRRLVDEIPAIMPCLAELLEQELNDAQHRFVEIASLDVPRRIAHALLRLVHQAGRKEEAGIRIDFPLSKQDLAALTGTTLFTVSRTLTCWERRGLLAGGRRTVLVRDIPALTNLATATEASFGA